jgi:hypothetical protein
VIKVTQKFYLIEKGIGVGIRTPNTCTLILTNEQHSSVNIDVVSNAQVL